MPIPIILCRSGDKNRWLVREVKRPPVLTEEREVLMANVTFLFLTETQSTEGAPDREVSFWAAKGHWIAEEWQDWTKALDVKLGASGEGFMCQGKKLKSCAYFYGGLLGTMLAVGVEFV